MLHDPQRRGRFRQVLTTEDTDPLAGVANLFDVALVFAVALMIAVFVRVPVKALFSRQDDVTSVKDPGTPEMEIVHRRGEKLEHYRVSQQEIAGDGQRLGVAYRLESGEVVYVPESTHD